MKLQADTRKHVMLEKHSNLVVVVDGFDLYQITRHEQKKTGSLQQLHAYTMVYNNI